MDFVDGAMFSRIPSSGGEINLTSNHSVSPKHDDIRRNKITMDFVDGAMFSRIPSPGGEINLTSHHSVSPKHNDIRRNKATTDSVVAALFSRIPSSCGDLNLSSFQSPRLGDNLHDDFRRRKPSSMASTGNRNSAPCQQNKMDESYNIKRQTGGLLQAAPGKQPYNKFSKPEISDIAKNNETKTQSSSLSNVTCTNTDVYSPESSPRIHKQPKSFHRFPSSNPTIKITESSECDPCLDRTSLSPTHMHVPGQPQFTSSEYQCAVNECQSDKSKTDFQNAFLPNFKNTIVDDCRATDTSDKFLPIKTVTDLVIENGNEAGEASKRGDDKTSNKISHTADCYQDSSKVQLSLPAVAVSDLEINSQIGLKSSDNFNILCESSTTPNRDASCASKGSSTFYLRDDEVIDQQIKLNNDGTCNERTSTHLYPRLSIADETGESDNAEPTRNGLDYTDAQESPKCKPLKIVGLVFPLFSLMIYIWDIVSDIKLAISYKENGDTGPFWITLACIVIPLVLMSIVDVSWVWIDRSTRSTSNVIRYVLGVLTLGRIVRAVLYMQHFVKGEILTSRQDRIWHRKRALEEKRDCLMLDFINAFAESVPQLFVQLYLLYALDLDLTVLRVLNLLSSWISIAWTYAAYYRCNKEALAGTQDVHICAFLIFFLSVLAALSARVMCIVLFLVYFKTWIGVVLLSVHFLATLLWILLKEKPTFEGTTSSSFGRFLYRVFFSYVSILCFVNLRNTRARYRITCFYVVLYIENFTIAALTLHTMLTYSHSESDKAYNLLALPIGLVFHVVLLLLYYQALHPKTRVCCQTIGKTSDLGPRS